MEILIIVLILSSLFSSDRADVTSVLPLNLTFMSMKQTTSHLNPFLKYYGNEFFYRVDFNKRLRQCTTALYLGLTALCKELALQDETRYYSYSLFKLSILSHNSNFTLTQERR